MASTPAFPAITAATPLRTLLHATLAFALITGCASARSGPPISPSIPRSLPPPERLEGDVGGLLGEEVRTVREELLGAAEYDLPIVANNWVEAELEFLLSQRRDVVESWMERGEYYRSFVQEVFREHGIPTDLYHLGLIESGFIPVARSHAGAVGVWQFMPATGGDVGLRVDGTVDERMDPVRSTRAAARYLRTLYGIHGDWALAAAAYNAGTGRISRGLERFAARDFWELAQRGDLAEETRRYVPRLFATTVIGRNRERFGFGPSPASPAFAFDSVHVELPVPLAELAEMGPASLDELTRMNPHLLDGITPEGGYWIWVPEGTGVKLQRAYLASTFRSDQGSGTYVVRWGDTLGKLAQRTGIASARIRELNPTIDFDRLMTGATIRLPANAARQLADSDDRDAAARGALADEGGPGSESGGEDRTIHEVNPGDTLSEIALHYSVSIEGLQSANGLTSTLIRPGQRLTIPAGEGRGAEDSGGEVASIQHIVESGDTLWGIARRYGTTIDSIERANELGERPIQPGQTLTVPR